MRNTRRRKLYIETFERRLALSASACVDVCDESHIISNGVSPGAYVGDIISSAVSTEAYVAADNAIEAARDLGTLDGSRSFFNEYVGRYDARDIYRFELPTAGAASIHLHGLAADADVYLLDVNQLTVAESVNWGAESELIQTSLQAGEYFVVVQNYGSWSSTPYSLDVQTTLDVPPDLAGNTFDFALDLGELESSQTFSDYVGDSDNADILQFHVDAAMYVNLELTAMSEDLDLYLVSSNQFRVGQSNELGNSSEGIDAWLSPDSYYVLVVPHGPVSSAYELHISSTFSFPDPIPPLPPTPQPDPMKPSTPELPTLGSAAKGRLVDVPYFGGAQDWGVNAVSAPEAWAAGYRGQGVTVALIDSGVQLDHPDLQQSIWVNANETPGDGIDNDGNGYVDDHFGWDFVESDGVPSASNSHGTNVAGIIATGNNGFGATGVAPEAQIMSLRVLDSEGNGSNFDVASAIRYAVDNGADVINLSLGGGNSSSIFSAVEYAGQNSVLVVAASGNDGANLPDYPGRHSSTQTNILSVGAFDNSYEIASFSNLVGGSNAVQIDAPGVGVYSTLTNDRYGYVSGTSLAAPFVAGLAALTLSANPGLTSAALRDVLVQGAIDQISGSDSIGAINAAATIPLALGASLSEITNAGAPTLTDPSSDEFGVQLNSGLGRRFRSPLA